MELTAFPGLLISTKELELFLSQRTGIPDPFQGAAELKQFQIQFPGGDGTSGNTVTVTPFLPNPVAG